MLPFCHLGKESGQHPAAFLRRLLVQHSGLFGLLPPNLEEVFHLLLSELLMGHRLDPAVPGDGQQTIIGNCGMVDLDVGELGDGGCLEQPAVVQPGAVEG